MTDRRNLMGRAAAAVCGALFLTVCATLAACGGGEPAAPVARLELGRSDLVLPAAGRATLATVWHPLTGLGPDDPHPVVFVHLLDRDGALLRTFDHPLAAGWVPGESVRDPVALWQSALAPPLDPGRYTLTLGLVDAGSGQRWPLRFAEPGPEEGPVEVDRAEYQVATVVVPADDAGAGGAAPRVSFEGPWRPPSRVDDRQLLATRMLTADGALVLRGVTEPLTVEMVLRIPNEEETGYRLVTEGGSAPPTATVRSTCAREPTEIAGSGSHEVRLMLRPPADGDECTVRIAPGYVYVDPTTFDRIALELRRLTWMPAAADEGGAAGGSAGEGR